MQTRGIGQLPDTGFIQPVKPPVVVSSAVDGFSPDFVGKKCVVVTKGTGVIKFVGFKPGTQVQCIGVHLDKANGSNAGIIGGHRYFDAPAAHGLLAPPSSV